MAALLVLALIAPQAATAAQFGPSGIRRLPPPLARLSSPKLLREGSRVLAYARFDHGASAALPAVRATGAQILDTSRRYQTVTVAAKPGELPEIAAVPHLAGLAAAYPPVTTGAGGNAPISSAISPCFGAATSEGDLQLNAMAARNGFEVDGGGVKVGILSDSFNRDVAADTRASTDIASGDLPGPGNPCGHNTPVQVLDDSEAGGEDEGRAMAQIVHDLAPGAGLAFASAFGGELSFAENITKLQEEGASVIADDVFYTEEPFFQDGPVAVAVNEAVEAGATYLSSAGNDNLIDSSGRDIASWEAPEFRDSGACPTPLVELSEEIEETEGPGTGLNPDHCMDFNPGGPSDDTFGITVATGETLLADLQWAEPLAGVTSDIDAYLLSASGEPVAASLEDNSSPSGTQRPMELLEWENDTGAVAHVKLVINRFGGSKETPLKFALLENGGGVTATEYPESSGGDTVGPTIFGHSGAASAISVGAAPFFENEEPERYSSQGPVTHYFEPVGTTPAEALTVPDVIPKPDVTATDGGANTFFGSCVSHVWRFFGTSAAAPHAAAVAALELQAEPGATPAEVREALTESASPMGAFPPEAVGTGLVDAPEAIAAISSTPFPGGTQFAQPTPQNCNLPSPPGPPSGPPPVSPPPLPGTSTTPASRPPRTFFRQRPHKVIRTHQRGALATFSFGSDRSDAAFACRIDGGLFRPCPPTLTRRFAVGPHTVRVVASDEAGGSDRSPAVYRFRVKHLD